MRFAFGRGRPLRLNGFGCRFPPTEDRMDSSPTAIRRFIGERHALALPLALGLALGACTDSRHEARVELRRLDEAMQQHAAVYGRFPATLDPRRPVSLTNLPYAPGREVDLHLQDGTQDSYAATARHGVWSCWMPISVGEKGEPACAPTGGGSSDDQPDTLGPPASPLDDMLTPRGTSPIQSDLPPSSSP